MLRSIPYPIYKHFVVVLVRYVKYKKVNAKKVSKCALFDLQFIFKKCKPVERSLYRLTTGAVQVNTTEHCVYKLLRRKSCVGRYEKTFF